MKRSNQHSDSDSDDDFGPRPSGAAGAEGDGDSAPSESTAANGAAAADSSSGDVAGKGRVLKKVRKDAYEQVFVENLPSAEQYEHSYMHRDTVTHVAVARQSDFIITGSSDGHVKFWKKMLKDIEFVKHYQAHLGPIHALVVSPDGRMLATTSADKMVKFFDVLCFDMSNMISVDYTPDAAVWICHRTGATSGLYDRVAVADTHSPTIRIYLAAGAQDRALVAEVALHTHPVKCMTLNVPTSTIISADAKGIIEYWDGETLESVSQPDVLFRYKTETDLYELAKNRSVPVSVSCSPNGDIFAVLSTDMKIRVFDFASGKLKRTYDESLAAYQQRAAAEGGSSNGMGFGRMMAIERELENSPDALRLCNLTFDESGHFLLFGSAVGIKVLNIVTNRVVRTLGANESGERFTAIALYQGTPKVDMQYLLSLKNSTAQTKTVDETEKANVPDPTVYCCSIKKRRFYCFSRREPDESEHPRDVLNEKPTEDERLSTFTSSAARGLPREATIRTSRGDIHMKLFADDCPRTIENFTTHAKNKYYDNVIFHRVIKGFMIQTGDPRGDGTGGESIWGGEFEDEIVKTLKHDRPYTVSMANAGPDSNGSQFFITTVATPWLDGKHTVFGRVTKGFEVINEIENARVGKYDKPFEDIRILGIDVK